jgi:hypothetical protein
MKTRKVFFIISFIFDWDLHCWDTLPYWLIFKAGNFFDTFWYFL